MEWIFYTLYAATGFGVLSVIAKNIMQDTYAEIYTALYSFLGLIFYLPVFLYYFLNSGINFTALALTALGASMIGNVLAFTVYNYSVKEGQLSRVIPMTRLTPIFAAAIAALVLGENVDLQLAAGILLATSGAIIVLKEKNISYLKSVEDGLHVKALQAAVLSSVLYGATSVADRYATQIIKPEIYTIFTYLALTTGMMIFVRLKFQNPKEEIISTFREYTGLYILTGLIAATATLAIFKAFSQASAAQVTTVQQFQVLIPVVAGVLMFDEGDLLRKLAGSIILIAGIGLTAL
ncbi:MAG: EamA family transporter [Candidatus Nanohaloarchaea archaeon]